MTDYKDPLHERIIFFGLNPLFRLLHADKYNLTSAVLIGLSILGLSHSMYMCSVIVCALSGLITFCKWTLFCGPMYKVYNGNRYYKESYLSTRSSRLPTLKLQANTPYENGFHYGVIMAEEITHLIKRLRMFVKTTFSPHKLISINSSLPEAIKEEIGGVFDALNLIYPGMLTYWDILGVQMIPEMDKMACTCYANRTKNGNVIFGRNMDWLSFSSAQYSIRIEYRKDNYTSLTVPGLIGCVTASKNDFILAMNVVGDKYISNTSCLPSTIMNKYIMIKSQNFNDACKMAEKGNPIGAYHLTIASKKDVVCYSYYQSPTRTVHIRKFSDQKDNFVVLNWTYPNNDKGRYVSAYRDTLTRNQSDTGISHVIDILKKCQSFETMHSLVCDFENKTLLISVDNGFACDSLEASLITSG